MSFQVDSENEVARRIVDSTRKRVPRELRDISGRALYSPTRTLVSDSKYYFLGANPGETPGGSEAHDLLTVEADLSRMAEGSIKEHGGLQNADYYEIFFNCDYTISLWLLKIGAKTR